MRGRETKTFIVFHKNRSKWRECLRVDWLITFFQQDLCGNKREISRWDEDEGAVAGIQQLMKMFCFRGAAMEDRSWRIFVLELLIFALTIFYSLQICSLSSSLSQTAGAHCNYRRLSHRPLNFAHHNDPNR